jgi:tetratricopeptide (TPR) repeat protein
MCFTLKDNQKESVAIQGGQLKSTAPLILQVRSLPAIRGVGTGLNGAAIMPVLNRPSLTRMMPIVALAAWRLCSSGEVQTDASSGIVLGAGNSQFAEGALALEEGRVPDGIRLTLAGLKDATDPFETAAAHSNLCGGYALLHELAEALEHCNTAIGLDPSNWHSFNNRAAVYAARGQYALALADLRTGLQLAPQSSTLLKSLSAVEHNQKVLNKHDATTLRS